MEIEKTSGDILQIAMQLPLTNSKVDQFEAKVLKKLEQYQAHIIQLVKQKVAEAQKEIKTRCATARLTQDFSLKTNFSTSSIAKALNCFLEIVQ